MSFSCLSIWSFFLFLLKRPLSAAWHIGESKNFSQEFDITHDHDSSGGTEPPIRQVHQGRLLAFPHKNRIMRRHKMMMRTGIFLTMARAKHHVSFQLDERPEILGRPAGALWRGRYSAQWQRELHIRYGGHNSPNYGGRRLEGERIGQRRGRTLSFTSGQAVTSDPADQAVLANHLSPPSSEFTGKKSYKSRWHFQL